MFYFVINLNKSAKQTFVLSVILTPKRSYDAIHLLSYYVALCRFHTHPTDAIHWLWINHSITVNNHNHQIKTFACYWPFVRGTHRSPVDSHQKGKRYGALMLSLICAWTNGWASSRHACDLRRHCAHYDCDEYIQFKTKPCAYRCLSVRLQYLQCVSNGDTAVWHWAIDTLWVYWLLLITDYIYAILWFTIFYIFIWCHGRKIYFSDFSHDVWSNFDAFRTSISYFCTYHDTWVIGLSG